VTAPKQRAVSGDAGLLTGRQTPAPAAPVPSQRPERAPKQCPTCGYVTIPAVFCANPECGHLEEVHAFNSKNTARTACSHHEGARNTPCPCRRFTPKLETETSQ
jgi:hypothetical protein